MKTISIFALVSLFLAESVAEKTVIDFIGAHRESLHSETRLAIPSFPSNSLQNLRIRSNIPVNILQYRPDSSFSGGELIGKDEAIVFIKSTCGDEKSYDVSVEMKTPKHSNRVPPLLNIRGDVGYGHSDELLPPSSYYAVKFYKSSFCANRNLETTGNETYNEEPLRNETIKHAVPVKMDESKKSVHRRAHECTFTADVILNGCDCPLMVTAPTFKVYSGVEHQTTSTDLVDRACGCTYYRTGPLYVPPESSLDVSRGGKKIFVEELDPFFCQPRAAEGRPFVDASNNVLTATAEITDNAEWSIMDTQEGGAMIETSSVEVESSYNTEASEWTTQALGEHSSIASFAAFTIALMTNGAPPSLIRDSLFAALDEVNHATTSFEMASLLSGQTIEPGELPSSSHEFKHDMESLVLGTAREGCVDETLSALIAAYKLSGGKSDIEGDYVRELIDEKMKVIAMEEATHSALAWRTVRWVCSVDAIACESVKKYFEEEAIIYAEKRLNSSGLQGDLSFLMKEWKRLFSSLVPFVTTKNLSHDFFNISESNISFVQMIVNEILLKVKESAYQQEYF